MQGLVADPEDENNQGFGDNQKMGPIAIWLYAMKVASDQSYM